MTEIHSAKDLETTNTDVDRIADRVASSPLGERRRIQRCAGDTAESFEVARAGRLDDFLRQHGRWRLAIPAPGLALRIEPVAQGLLVKAGLRAARRIAVRRPEPRTVRCHDFVDQQNLAA